MKRGWRPSSVRKGWPLWLGLFAMFVGTLAVIIGVLAFAGGGKQRGLVIRDESGQPVSVDFDDGQHVVLGNREEKTIGAKREHYPQTMRVSDAHGAALWSVRLTFEDLSTNSFRLVIGATGIIPTPPQSGG
jgi:hypothetical protein